MKERIIAIIDHPRQAKQKNIWIGDYPMINAWTGRKLKRNFDFYYSDYKDYEKNMREKQVPECQW